MVWLRFARGAPADSRCADGTGVDTPHFLGSGGPGRARAAHAGVMPDGGSADGRGEWGLPGWLAVRRRPRTYWAIF
jgi:hypothetical protein